MKDSVWKKKTAERPLYRLARSHFPFNIPSFLIQLSSRAAAFNMNPSGFFLSSEKRKIHIPLTFVLVCGKISSELKQSMSVLVNRSSSEKTKKRDEDRYAGDAVV